MSPCVDLDSLVCKGTPQFLTILALSDSRLIRLQHRIASDRIMSDRIVSDRITSDWITSDSVGWQPCLPVMVVYYVSSSSLPPYWLVMLLYSPFSRWICVRILSHLARVP